MAGTRVKTDAGPRPIGGAQSALARRPLAWILAVFVVAALLQNLALPMFEAPDEAAHFYFAHALAQNGRIPELTDNADTHEVFQPPLYYAALAPLIAPIERGNLERISVRNRDWWEVRGVTNQYLHFPDEHFPYAGAVWAVRLARLVSTVLGAATIVFAHAIARGLLVTAAARTRLAGRPALAAVPALTAAALALNPKFINIAAVVNNDIAIIFTATVTCWWMVRVVGGAGRALDFAVLGGLIGVAGLAKISGLGLLLPAAFCAVVHAARTSGRAAGPRAVRAGLAIAAGLALTSGWWLALNAQRFGDPLASSLVRDANAPLERAAPLDAAGMLATLPALAESSWGALGIDLRLPAWANAIYAGVAALGAIGCVAFATRARRDEIGAFAVRLAPLALWQSAVIAAFVPWLRTITDTENSRLLMPGAAFAAALLALGWVTLVEMLDAAQRRVLASRVLASRVLASRVLAAVIAGMAALALSAPFIAVTPAFAQPTFLSEREIAQLPARLNASFGGRVRLLHAELAARDARPGDDVSVTVYWGAERAIPVSMRAIVEAVDARGEVIGRVEGVPFGGRFATSRWPEGQIFRDAYTLRLNAAAERGVAEVRIGWRSPYEQPEVLTIGGANRFAVGKLKVNGPEPQAVREVRVAPFAAGATFGGVIRLDGFELTTAASRAELVFDFRALGPTPKGYTLFVHAFDAAGMLIAQSDGPPLEGAYPTDFWSAGERVIERRPFDIPAATRTLTAGWYDPATGERLRAAKADGSPWRDDVAILMER